MPAMTGADRTAVDRVCPRAEVAPVARVLADLGLLPPQVGVVVLVNPRSPLLRR